MEYSLADIILSMQRRYNEHDFGDVVRSAFDRSGRSIKSVADESGVPYAGVYKFVNARSDVRTSTLTAIARALELELRSVKRKRKGKAKT